MCGIVGVWDVHKAAELTVIGLHALQHRARDFAGIVSTDGANFYREKGPGIVRQVFDEEKLRRLHGKGALGHIRYSTVTNEKNRDNTQPIQGIYNGKPIAIAHNGNLTNTIELREMFPMVRLATSMDTEWIVRLLEIHPQTGDIEKDLAGVLSLCEGSFALGILMPDRLIVAMDGWQNRPLSVGRLNGGWCIVSETCALPLMEAEFEQDISPGTIVTLRADGIRTLCFTRKPHERRCVFELLYYASPTSKVFGVHVASFRKKAGRRLAELFPFLGKDVLVMPVPDSGIFYALGFGMSGLSGEVSLASLRNHYVGRTFVAAKQANREEEVTRKFLFDQYEIEGARIALIDDSIVRATTGPKFIAKLRQLRAKEVHMIVPTPPIERACRYGINMVDEKETRLAATENSVEEICRLIGADSLHYLPVEELKALLPDPHNYCFTCMPGGQYW